MKVCPFLLYSDRTAPECLLDRCAAYDSGTCKQFDTIVNIDACKQEFKATMQLYADMGLFPPKNKSDNEKGEAENAR